MKYCCSLIVVESIQRSREFYEDTLRQKVQYDFGENVSFEGGFAIHLRSHYEKLIKDGFSNNINYGSNSFELYFETEKLDEIYQKLLGRKMEFVHEIKEQPWGQRVLRVYDPDQHIVEIGETLESVVLRLFEQGFSLDEIVKRSSMPMEFVESVIKRRET